MSATNRRIIVWGTSADQTTHGGPGQRRAPLLRRRESDNLQQRYSEITALAARLIDECRRLRHDNDDLRASAEIWIRLYECQLARANALERPLRALLPENEPAPDARTNNGRATSSERKSER